MLTLISCKNKENVIFHHISLTLYIVYDFPYVLHKFSQNEYFHPYHAGNTNSPILPGSPLPQAHFLQSWQLDRQANLQYGTYYKVTRFPYVQLTFFPNACQGRKLPSDLSAAACPLRVDCKILQLFDPADLYGRFPFPRWKQR